MNTKKTRFQATAQQPNVTKKTKIFHTPSISIESQISQEQIPQVDDLPLPSQKIPSQPMKYKVDFLIKEDPRQSRFSHGRLLTIQKLSCLLTCCIFFLTGGKTEIDIIHGNSNHPSAIYLMNAISLCISILFIVVFLRHLCLFELQTIQKKVYRQAQSKQSLLMAFLKRSERRTTLIFEALLIFPHPISCLTGSTFRLFQTLDEVYWEHSYNDILSLLLGLKIYIIARSLLTLSCYSSPRASRLCHQNGLQHNHVYIVKCVLHEQPLITIAVSFGITMIVGGYCLKLSEGVLPLYNPGLKTGFESYSNCFWCVFASMSTVGYGDYVPKTLPGRSVILLTSILGVFISSLLIVSLSLHLQMQPGQNKSHVVLDRLSQQAKLKKQASKIVFETINMQSKMNKKENYLQQKQIGDFASLREHIELAKQKVRKIKSLVATDDVVEEMSRLFYILRDNLKDIYSGQLQLSQHIKQIQQTQKIRLSFIREVSEMLEKTQIHLQPLSSAHGGFSLKNINTDKIQHQE